MEATTCTGRMESCPAVIPVSVCVCVSVCVTWGGVCVGVCDGLFLKNIIFL